MKKNQFLILIVLGLLVGGLGLRMYNKQKQTFSASGFSSGQKVLENFPLNEVAQIHLKQNEASLTVERSGDTWAVKERWGYPANFTEISDFLRKLWELKPVQDVEVGPSQYGRLELNTGEGTSTNSGTLVEFKDGKGTALKSVVFGKKFMKESAGGGPMGGGGEYPVGRYVMVPGNPAKVWLVNETFANVEPKADQWISKDFIKVEKVKSVSVDRPGETNDWSIARETESGEWKMAGLAESEKFENSKASSLNYALSSPSFNDIAAPELTPEQTGFKEPTIAKLETFEGFVYTINIGSQTNSENYYLQARVDGKFPTERTAVAEEKPEDKEKLDKEFKEKTEKLQEKLKKEQAFGKWTYLVSKWTVDALLKERKDFMAEKKAEEPAATAIPANPVDGATPPVEVVPPELRSTKEPPIP
jgi:Domain of unknown function (DUF4340)